VLFDEEEAKIALHMPFVRFTAEMLAEKTGKSLDYVEKILNEMAEKGTVWKGEKDGKTYYRRRAQSGRVRNDGKTYYRLFPVIVGFAETPFWSGPCKDPRQEKLAKLWNQYRKEGFLDEIGDREHPIMRALPERDTISEKSEILPYEDAVKLVKEKDYIAVGYCPCRVMARLVGEGCRHSIENCIHMGSVGKYMVEHGLGRRVSADEAIQILKQSNREGLVHLTESKHVATICNCCSDCCVFFKAVHEAKHPNTIAHSSYLATVDTSRCIACGICTLRCPMKAIKAKINREPANVDVEKCLGCGVCVPTCPMEAIELVERGELLELPDGMTYIQELLADKGRDPSGLF